MSMELIAILVIGLVHFAFRLGVEIGRGTRQGGPRLPEPPEVPKPPKVRGGEAERCPDAPRYKACGNSMCVNVMRWIGVRINRVEKENREDSR